MQSPAVSGARVRSRRRPSLPSPRRDARGDGWRGAVYETISHNAHYSRQTSAPPHRAYPPAEPRVVHAHFAPLEHRRHARVPCRGTRAEVQRRVAHGQRGLLCACARVAGSARHSAAQGPGHHPPRIRTRFATHTRTAIWWHPTNRDSTYDSTAHTRHLLTPRPNH